MVELVTSNYTNVLFDLAMEEDHPEEISEELATIAAILEQNPEYKIFLTSPQIAKEDKIRSVDKIFGDQIEKTTKNFIKVLIENGRSAYLPEVAKVYKKLLREHLGIVYVEAITAVPMDEDQKQRLIEKLEQRLHQRVELNNLMDENIIGGMKIRVGEKSLDASVSSRLRTLQSELSK